MEDIFDKVLHYYGRKGEKQFVINIGAMDGVLFDTLTGYVEMYGFSGLYVEPIKEHFERLVKNKSHIEGNKFENSAITNYNGTITMTTIPNKFIDGVNVIEAFKGMSAIDPSRNGMGTEGDKPIVEKYGVDVEVNCLTFESLLKKHQIDNFDIISVDTEGHDAVILKLIDIAKYLPKLIRLEYCNLTNEEKEEVKAIFEKNGYVYEITPEDGEMDIDAVRRDVYDEVSSSLSNVLVGEVTEASTVEDSTVTLVTGLWDIKRGDLGEGWSRSFDYYLEKFSELLDTPDNMIIFGDAELRDFVFNKRNENNTIFIERPVEWFNNEFFDKIQSIRNSESWLAQAGWLSESTQAKLEYYNPLVMSKPFLLHDAKIFDQFNSTHMYWVDAGLTNTVHWGYFTHDKVIKKLSKIDGFNFVAFPYDAQNEIHGFEYSKLCELAGDKVNKVCRGGFFGGDIDSISIFNQQYYDLLSVTLSEGYMGTEESLFTILTYRYPENYSYFQIEPNGMISTFFEELKNDQHRPKKEGGLYVKNNGLDITNTALYVITFNSPNQVKTLIKSMLEYDSDFVTQPKWVMLDNSTDESTTPEYKDICEKYNIEHIKKDNLGICGGRQFIAEHAEENGYDYYFFFEDDMFLYPKEGEVCKNGFNRYVKNLYRKSLEIASKNSYDYLKLSYTEFYGDNRTQWAWYNVPQSVREEYWPNKNRLPVQGLDPNAPLTEIKKIDTHKGIPYAEGDVYYCNWPQIVSKTGNVKMFLTEKWAHPFEQTWMSYMYQETKKGKLNPAILLLTPIEHDRFDFYPAEIRKES